MPFVLRAVVLVVMFGVAFRVMRDIGFTPVQGEHPLGEMRRIAARSVEYGWRVPAVKWLMVESLVTGGVGIYAFYALQPYLLELWGNPEAYQVAGLVAAIVAGSQILGGLAAPWIRAASGGAPRPCSRCAALSALTLALIGVVDSFWGVLALIVAWGLLFAASRPIRQTYLNGLIPSKQRATILSFDSMMTSTGGVWAQPVLGRSADVWGYPQSYVLSAGISALALPFLALSRRENAEADFMDSTTSAAPGTGLGRRGPESDTRQIREPGDIERDDYPTLCDRGRGNQHVVSTAWAARSPRVREQSRVYSRNLEVVRLHRNHGQHVRDERLPPLAPASIRELHADEQLGRRDRSDHGIVLVADQLVEGLTRALACDEHRRIENQSLQCLSSTTSVDRRERSSSAHSGSGWAERSNSLTMRPSEPTAGPMRATGRPCRTTTNDSPRPSTASRSSENRRAASVALSRCIKIRLSDSRPTAICSVSVARTPSESGSFGRPESARSRDAAEPGLISTRRAASAPRRASSRGS